MTIQAVFTVNGSRYFQFSRSEIDIRRDDIEVFEDGCDRHLDIYLGIGQEIIGGVLHVGGVPELWIPCSMARPHSYRLTKRPITRSCIGSVCERPIVRRSSRLMQVRRLMCLLSILCLCSFPTVCSSASTWRSYVLQPSVEYRVMPNGVKSAF